MAFTKELGIKNFYLDYTEECNKEGSNHVNYKLFASILKDFNILLRDIILDNNIVKLPFSLGFLAVLKFQTVFSENNKSKWKVDFKKSKELGFKVYYGDEYGYRWKWYKTIFYNKGNKNFKYVPCRYCSRAIAKNVKSGSDYYFDQSYPLREYKTTQLRKIINKRKVN